MDQQKKDDLVILINVGTNKIVQNIAEYTLNVSQDHSDQILIIKNILLNSCGNIFKVASETPEAFKKKLKTFTKDLEAWSIEVIKQWDKKGEIRGSIERNTDQDN